MKVLAICGSLRAASMNAALLRATGTSEDRIVASERAPRIRAALAALAQA